MPERSPAVPVQLFYSYSHKDERLRDRLEVHLSSLIRDWQISGWHDRKIGAGAEWKGVIDDHLKAAGIILLLVSADFLASKYCYDVELQCAMERHQKGQARVIPVILRPCDWKTTIFARLQALPTDGKPVTRWANRDEAFLNIAHGIRRALQEMGFSGPSVTMPQQAGATALVSPVSDQKQSPSPVPALNILHQLPAPPADFVGRATELNELLAAVKTAGVAICGMQGLGGVGKTALALKLAELLKPDYPDAQFYLDLKGVKQPLTPRDAMAHIVYAWHPTAQLPEQEAELAPLYRSVLDGKRALLLMDNARDAQQVAPLIPPAGCLLLVTSRKHFTLPGLMEKNLDKLPPNDARDLLLRIVPRLKKEKPEQVNELARLCGYLPLALRAVGSALEVKKNISPADYANRMKETGKHVVLKEIDPSLQSSVGVVLQSLYGQLSSELQQKLRLLSVFPDSFDLVAAGAVWETLPVVAQDRLGELLAYTLIEFEESTKRYRLHDLVHLFTAQLLEADQRNTALKRHAGHYLRVLEAADEFYLRGGESMTLGLALFNAEWTNIQAGYKWVVAHQDDKTVAEWCWKYPDAGVYCLSLRQPPHERIRWLESALAAAQRLKRRAWEANSLGNLGVAYHDLGEYRHAIEHHEKRLQIVRQIGDQRSEGRTLGNLGRAYRNLGDYRRAVEFLEQDLRIVREIGDRRGEGTTLGNLGLAYDNLGDYRRAISYHEQHLQITRDFGNRVEEGRALGNLGRAYRNLGEYRRAIEFLEQDLRIAREIGDRLGESKALSNLGLACDNMGDHGRAIECYEQQLKITQEIGNRGAEGRALGGLGTAYYRLGEYRRAVDYQEHSLQIALEVGDRPGEAHAQWHTALAVNKLGNRAAAIICAEAALQIYEAIESPHASKVRNQLVEWRGEDTASAQSSPE